MVYYKWNSYKEGTELQSIYSQTILKKSWIIYVTWFQDLV